MSLHHCTESECPFLGQTTNKSCKCHKTDEQVLRDRVSWLREAAIEMLAAGDAMLAFILTASPEALGEKEWDRQHKSRSERQRNAIAALHVAIDGTETKS